MADKPAPSAPSQLPYPVLLSPPPAYGAQPGFAPQPSFAPTHGFPPGAVPLRPLAEIGPASNDRTLQNLSGPSPYIGFAPSAVPVQPPPYSNLVDPKYDQHGGDPSEASFSNQGDGDRDPVLEQFGKFSDKAIRQAFVRKVYAILMIQLAITVGFVALFIYEPHVKNFVQTTPEAYIAAYVTFVVVYFALVCAKGLRRTYPTNIILLFVFTLVMSYLVGTISSFHSTDTVLMAAGICAICCLVVSLFSCYSKFDFTTCGGFLFVGLWVLILFGILTIFTYSRIMNTVYAGLGALLFMAFLAFDTQRIMGGRKVELSPEEHIFAALQLYMDIVQLFLLLLRLLSSRR